MSEQPTEPLSIKEEYQLWRENCRYMYEFVSETALTWPSLTIQWLPKYTQSKGLIDAKLLLGTHTSNQSENQLKVASTQLSADPNVKANSKIKIVEKLENNAEICRARYMPQDANIVATINGLGEVDLYNLDTETRYSHFAPHTKNGYGISWNPKQKGLLVTGADDHLVCVSDTTTTKTIFKSDIQKDIVNDVKWHQFNGNLFASVSEDSHVYLFDIRDNKVVSEYYAESSNGINSLAFSSFAENLMAIGNTNSNINLLDLRKLDSSSGLLHTMMGHSEGITCMEFSPHHDGILATGSQDRRIIIWDLFKVGEEQQQEDAEDGCPELFMMHAGHTAGVSDLSWCPFKEWMIGSVADDNIVHLWEISKKLITNEEVEVDESVLE
ncbi:histone acetyltransferase type B subunit 2, putative [Candida dubliniensis CD36]|uniref:Histone acetyltransferase type B subunit 2, putative n=1 Tax=Candida dubliniensis (strain CD36 / ATCC MYA-646 / CBS 7987 / NCPF 3949 / NRRL Y-17841) TaxID=573826 RepID=B9W854_CANDC|nr:histone acetyltransferase type B subunit 2, putative [Candida dubliniensis CD36]CAX44892.1 histone acetyltransferase type B subunit 2, putative [Candida dubliniensis CD36]